MYQNSGPSEVLNESRLDTSHEPSDRVQIPLFEVAASSAEGYRSQMMKCFLNLLEGTVDEPNDDFRRLAHIGSAANDMDDVHSLLVSNTARPQFWGVPERGQLKLEEHTLYWAPEVSSGECYIFGDCEGRMPVLSDFETPDKYISNLGMGFLNPDRVMRYTYNVR